MKTEQKSAKSKISRRNFLFLLEDAETAKIFARSLAKHKRHLKKIFINPIALRIYFPFQSPPPKATFQVVYRGMASTLSTQAFDIAGQIVGIINSDCRFRVCISYEFFSHLVCCWRTVFVSSLGKCYIYFLVEDSMKLKVFQIIFFDDYSHSLYIPFDVKEISIRSFFS
jgi:hypothetical protein